ncbi:hypothetical protein QL285_042541 [Trifolium repens]|nr:hypothetical protein QL285_042541 [Trifolium repens]
MQCLVVYENNWLSSLFIAITELKKEDPVLSLSLSRAHHHPTTITTAPNVDGSGSFSSAATPPPSSRRNANSLAG